MYTYNWDWQCDKILISLKNSLNLPVSIISSVESQKDVIAVQRCSVENQKGAIAIDFVQQ